MRKLTKYGEIIAETLRGREGKLYEHIATAGTPADKRAKLTPEQRADIKDLHASGAESINGLARRYGVSKRLVQFILFPERLAIARERVRLQRDQYPSSSKAKRREYMHRHRAGKRGLFIKEHGRDIATAVNRGRVQASVKPLIDNSVKNTHGNDCQVSDVTN